MTTPDTSDDFKLSIDDTLKEIYRFLWSAKNSFILIATLPVTGLSLYWVTMADLAVVTVPGDSANPAALWELCAHSSQRAAGFALSPGTVTTARSAIVTQYKESPVTGRVAIRMKLFFADHRKR